MAQTAQAQGSNRFGDEAVGLSGYIINMPAEGVGYAAKIIAGDAAGNKHKGFNALMDALETEGSNLPHWLIYFETKRLMLVADIPHDDYLSLLNYRSFEQAGQTVRVFWFFDTPFDDQVLTARGIPEYLAIPGAKVVSVEDALCDYYMSENSFIEGRQPCA